MPHQYPAVGLPVLAVKVIGSDRTVIGGPVDCDLMASLRNASERDLESHPISWCRHRRHQPIVDMDDQLRWLLRKMRRGRSQERNRESQARTVRPPGTARG